MAVNGSSKSPSKDLRDEGNKLLSSVDENLAPVLRRSRFEQVLLKYNKALNAAQNMDEKLSAMKNIAVVSVKMAKLIDPNKDLNLLLHYLKDASENYSQSFNSAEGVKSNDWKMQLLTSLYHHLEGIDDLTESLTFQKKMSIMETSVYSLTIDSVRGEYCFKMAEMCFHESILRLDGDSFKDSLARLGDCYRPLEEIERIKSCDAALLLKVSTLKEDLKYQTFRSESLQALRIGDELFGNYYCEEDENCNIDMAWEIIDFYKKATLLTRELEIEIEAIATSRIGRIYDKIFKVKSDARENFKRAIELALTMHPRSFENDDWFKECKETLERYRQEQIEQESELWSNKRKKYLIELEEELKDLEINAAKSDVDLLKWLYKSHPPKKKNCKLPKKLPELSAGKTTYDKQMKKLMKDAIVHYHPDRSEPEVNGMKWKVLCEEICKILTGRYESFKDCS